MIQCRKHSERHERITHRPDFDDENLQCIPLPAIVKNEIISRWEDAPTVPKKGVSCAFRPKLIPIIHGLEKHQDFVKPVFRRPV